MSKFRPILAIAFLFSWSGLAGILIAEESHRVQPSQTFYSISREHGVSVKALMAENGVSDPTKLQVGQKLKIPGKTTSAPKPATRSVSTRVAEKRTASSTAPVIVIDPGHGGKDQGAARRGVKEKDLNLAVAERLKGKLESRGYKVVLTRRSDVFVSLSRRAGVANEYRNALFVSIHFNAMESAHSNIRGGETFYASASGGRLARSVQGEMVRQCGLRNRGTAMARYSVLVNTRCPAILVEGGYMSNSSELDRLKSGTFQSQMAEAIADGIDRYRQ